VAPLFRKYNACKCDLVLYNVSSILMIDTMRQEVVLMSVIVKDLWAVKDFLEAMIILELAM
jgi:hypothetical protein